MAKKKSPKDLRAKAKELSKKADVEENKQYMKIGQMVKKELNKKDSFSSDDAEELRAEIEGLKGKINEILES